MSKMDAVDMETNVTVVLMKPNDLRMVNVKCLVVLSANELPQNI